MQTNLVGTIFLSKQVGTLSRRTTQNATANSGTRRRSGRMKINFFCTREELRKEMIPIYHANPYEIRYLKDNLTYKGINATTGRSPYVNHKSLFIQYSQLKKAANILDKLGEDYIADHCRKIREENDND
jgi:hypothetical protein